MPTGILSATNRLLGKQKASSWTISTFNRINLKQYARVGQALTHRKHFLLEWDESSRSWCNALWEGKAERRCFSVVFFRQEAEDKFTYTQEVDHLGNAKQRCNDQGSTVGSLQEGWWTLLTHDFPGEEIKVSYKKVKHAANTSHVPVDIVLVVFHLYLFQLEPPRLVV